MRMKSKKALELCRECRERLLSEISTVEQEKSPNYKIMGAAVDVILKLNIQELCIFHLSSALFPGIQST